MNARTGNHKRTVTPGGNLTNNYSITLQDVDTSILNHVKNVIKPTIREANEVYKVPVIYGNEERWKSARKRGVLLDKNGHFHSSFNSLTKPNSPRILKVVDEILKQP